MWFNEKTMETLEDLYARKLLYPWTCHLMKTSMEKLEDVCARELLYPWRYKTVNGKTVHKSLTYFALIKYYLEYPTDYNI